LLRFAAFVTVLDTRASDHVLAFQQEQERSADVNRFGWVGPLVATFALQVATAYLTRLLPTIAPALADQFGWAEGSIGYLAGLTMVGSMVFLMGGGPLIRRFGSIRTLQLGLALAGIGLLALLAPSLMLAAVASILIGLGYGPSVPAGNDVLQRFAPQRHRGLIFSVKQAGVPLGGVIAGFVLPVLVDNFGWQSSLVFSGALVISTLIAVQPFRGAIDATRDPHQPIGLDTLLSLSNLARPLATLRTAPDLTRIGIAGGCLAAAQGAWLAFLVSYAVSNLNLTLAQAGLLFAVMQATGMGGRLVLGFIADRLRSGILALILVAVTSGLASFAFVLASPSWPLSVLVGVTALSGLSVTSWNGVQLAELARLAPPTQVADASAGGTVLVFVGFVLGPVLFALLVGLTHRYELGYLLIGLVALTALWPLARVEQRYDRDVISHPPSGR
jgi:MFS family permease